MIKKIRVQNFKSLKDVTLRLGLRNVLVGPNMAGKSNLIEVFRFLTRMVMPGPDLYGLVKAVAASGGFSELVWKGGDSSLIAISISGELLLPPEPGSRAEWQYGISVLGDNRGGLTVQEESLWLLTTGGRFALVDKAEGERVLKNPDGRVVSRIVDRDRSALEFEIPDWGGEHPSSVHRFLAVLSFDPPTYEAAELDCRNQLPQRTRGQSLLLANDAADPIPG